MPIISSASRNIPKVTYVPIKLVQDDGKKPQDHVGAQARHDAQDKLPHDPSDKTPHRAGDTTQHHVDAAPHAGDAAQPHAGGTSQRRASERAQPLVEHAPDHGAGTNVKRVAGDKVDPNPGNKT